MFIPQIYIFSLVQIRLYLLYIAQMYLKLGYALEGWNMQTGDKLKEKNYWLCYAVGAFSA